jgi:hypothetical protein
MKRPHEGLTLGTKSANPSIQDYVRIADPALFA